MSSSLSNLHFFLAGLAWGGNSALFYLTYYEDFDAATFLSWVPVVGGASGVFFGGIASDWIKQRLGLRARLWLLGTLLVGLKTISPSN